MGEGTELAYAAWLGHLTLLMNKFPHLCRGGQATRGLQAEFPIEPLATDSVCLCSDPWPSWPQNRASRWLQIKPGALMPPAPGSSCTSPPPQARPLPALPRGNVDPHR